MRVDLPDFGSFPDQKFQRYPKIPFASCCAVCSTRRLRDHENNRARFHASLQHPRVPLGRPPCHRRAQARRRHVETGNLAMMCAPGEGNLARAWHGWPKVVGLFCMVMWAADAAWQGIATDRRGFFHGQRQRPKGNETWLKLGLPSSTRLLWQKATGKGAAVTQDAPEWLSVRFHTLCLGPLR